jgi:hypothetical protein
MTISILEGDIVNIKWDWQLVNGTLPAGKREARQIPDDLLNTNLTLSTSKKLSSCVKIQNSQTTGLQISVFGKDQGVDYDYWTLNGLLYDEYLNWINVTINTTDTGDNFKGVFGLGERANKDFFFKDGVYSMWTRDSLTPDENGELPGNNMYGVHPIYMFK